MLTPTIGIEVHIELKSKAKVFSTGRNDFQSLPNTNVNILDLAYPGVLPKLNKEIINMGIKTCLALNCNISKTMYFDRKNYFYPDLPKGYQITQKNTPIGTNGYLEIEVDGKNKKVEIEELHIEEDTCKSIHKDKKTYLNYNRAGVPLIEIVTKPCIHSSKEAKLYVEKLRETLLYLGISDVKIEEGSMRCDANVSLSDNDTLGTKTEIKNIGSISHVAIAIEKEIKRQEEILNSGGKIVEETRRFDDKKMDTVRMRIKETGNDYRYFPEPDLPYVTVSEKEILEIKNNLPILPDELRVKFQNIGLNENNIKTIIANIDICHFFLKLKLDNNLLITACNLLTGDVLAYLNKNNLTLDKTKIEVSNFEKLVKLLVNKEISNRQAKEIITIMLDTGDDVKKIIKDKGFSNVTDDKVIKEIINKILNENQESVNDYKNGKDRALKYLMGQIMKETKGSLDPSLVQKLLLESLSL